MQTIHQNPSFQLLLTSTEELILEKGCQQTTLQDIMKRSGLSKGAIYHYVKSKDELMGLLLQKRFETIGQQFYQSVQTGGQELSSGLEAISNGLRHIHDSRDVTNLILIYLLSKREDPIIGAMLARLHEASIQASKEWIEVGQKGGVIPASLDAEKTARLFSVITYGIRMNTQIAPDSTQLSAGEVYKMMFEILSKG
ncbi:TetR/AcrR family transcriptional regulator [Brevibacillus reuszeri]|uniref:TetR/AcrR family transcriptional regulator n=1 Tax=Brevibacillus reuszeri TaxID=54915 RepID=UPI0028A07641|nr:TetR/AcrR family transcriptional regulator [Brevibacillus reuszeri]